MNLQEHIDDHESFGAKDASKSLGFQDMPEGYALMLNSDFYYYWLRHDGAESAIDWDKWSVYRGAKLDKKDRK